ncbi:MAG: twin-arginine translocation signal domain-containing protein, partial [Actinomycetota bacterium]
MGRRTPLMRAMRELAEVHASLPEDRSLSFDEAIDLHDRGLTRRQLLKGAGVLGATAAIAGPPLAALARPRRRSANDPRVV